MKHEPPRTANATQARATVEHGLGSGVTEDHGGARLLLTDARVALLLLNEARYRTIERLFGLPKDQANAASVIAGLVVAETLHQKGKRVLQGPALPAVGDTALGASLLRELVYGISGRPSQDTPLIGTLIAIGVLGGLARPAVTRTLHGVRASSHRMHLAFNHRYGDVRRRGRQSLR